MLISTCAITLRGGRKNIQIQCVDSWIRHLTPYKKMCFDEKLRAQKLSLPVAMLTWKGSILFGSKECIYINIRISVLFKKHVFFMQYICVTYMGWFYVQDIHNIHGKNWFKNLLTIRVSQRLFVWFEIFPAKPPLAAWVEILLSGESFRVHDSSPFFAMYNTRFIRFWASWFQKNSGEKYIFSINLQILETRQLKYQLGESFIPEWHSDFNSGMVVLSFGFGSARWTIFNVLGDVCNPRIW